MSENSTSIAVSQQGCVGIIELNRPQIFNCLSIETFVAIEHALAAFENAPDVCSLLFKARGKHFCTGAELGEVKIVRMDDAQLAHFLAVGHRVLQRIEQSRLPAIAAVHGLCLAGGLELVLACDVVFAGDSARFGDQHAQFGLIPGWGGSQRLPRTIGLRRAMDLFLSARWIDAKTAESWSLVNRVLPDAELDGEALKYAAAIGERNSPGISLMKRLARQGLDLSLADGLLLEQREALAPLKSDDVSEGLRAFEEKRNPSFG